MGRVSTEDVLHENLHANANQHQPSDDFDLSLKKVPENGSKVCANEGHDKRDSPYDEYREYNAEIDERQGKANGKRINTCGYGQDEEYVDIQWVGSLVVL